MEWWFYVAHVLTSLQMYTSSSLLLGPMMLSDCDVSPLLFLGLNVLCVKAISFALPHLDRVAFGVFVVPLPEVHTSH